MKDPTRIRPHAWVIECDCGWRHETAKGNLRMEYDRAWAKQWALVHRLSCPIRAQPVETVENANAATTSTVDASSPSERSDVHPVNGPDVTQ